jgi:hypothetical protein
MNKTFQKKYLLEKLMNKLLQKKSEKTLVGI